MSKVTILSAVHTLAGMIADFFIPLMLLMVIKFILGFSIDWNELIKSPDFLLTLLILSSTTIGKLHSYPARSIFTKEMLSIIAQLLIGLTLVVSFLYVQSHLDSDGVKPQNLAGLIEWVGGGLFVIAFGVRYCLAQETLFEFEIDASGLKKWRVK